MLLPISACVLIVPFGYIMCYASINDKPITFAEWLMFVALFYVVIILPYNALRWQVWGRKKFLKKASKKLFLFKEAERLVINAKQLADTINQTTNREEFENSISELKDVFSKLVSFEKYDIFKDSTPSEDLKEFLEKEPLARIEFKKRETFEPKPAIPAYDLMNGHEFEQFCATILKENGFNHVEVTKVSGDHGIDILADKDEISYAIQCKCYSSNVGNDAVQQALAGKKFYKRDIAVVLTNQYFTPQAKEEASVFGVKLWDRTKLNEFVQNIKNIR